MDLQTDLTNCGTCGTACTNGDVCKSGSCQPPCPTGQTSCSGTCVNTNTSKANCGTCGNACTGTQVCTNGMCGISCSSGETACSGLCVDLKIDTSNCGTCGTTCTASQVCSNGSCACPSGTSTCSGACVDLQNDRNNCGTCGTACTGAQVCIVGVCQGIWTSVQSGDTSTDISSIAANNKGNVYVTGTSPRSDGQPNLMLKKIDSSGNTTDLSILGVGVVGFQADLSAHQSITNKNWNDITGWRTSGVAGLFNAGGHFNTNGQFTAPHTGYYFFSARVRVDNLTSGTVEVLFRINGQTQRNNGTIAQKSGTESFETFNPEGILYLTAGQKVTLSIQSSSDNNYSIQEESGFSGFFLGTKLDTGFQAKLNVPQNINGNWTTARTWITSNSSSLFSNGSSFNASTGEFTAPQDGVYYFSARPAFVGAMVRISGIPPQIKSNANIEAALSINGSTSVQHYAALDNQTSFLVTLNVGGFMRLKKGDKVSLRVKTNATQSPKIDDKTGFSGYLVGNLGSNTNNYTTGFSSALSANQTITATGWQEVKGYSNAYTTDTFFLTSLNSTSDFNATTGEYTAPQEGYYHLQANLVFNNAQTTGGYIRGIFAINGQNSLQQGANSLINGPFKSRHTLYLSSMLYLAAGDKVKVRVYSHKDNNYYLGTSTRFSGYLMSPKTASIQGAAVATDSSDNLYVAGTVQGKLELAESINTAVPYTFLAKRKTDGTWEWQKVLSREAPNSLTLDSNGNVILCGNIDKASATSFVSGTTFGDKEAYAIKHSAAGAQQWVRILYSQDAVSKSPKCAVTNTGELYVMGNFTKKLNITSSTTGLTNTSGNYRFLAKLASSNGNLSWLKQFNNSTDLFDIAANQDGGKQAYILGTFSTIGTFDTSRMTSSTKEIFVASIKDDGTIEWTQQSKVNSNNIRPGKIGFYKDRIYVTGDFNGNVEFGSKAYTTFGGYDIFIANLNTSGRWMWARTATGSLDEFSSGIAFDNAGNYYLSGSFKSSALTFSLLVANKKAGGANYDGAVAKNLP
ncbi:MAG: hypothetical protein H6728_01635 [Myxococcales bacterium]|nr:hypothetical protein [Myxococcales bacterium]